MRALRLAGRALHATLIAGVVAAAATSCVVETFTDGESGTVYECRAPDGDAVEWCAILDADELGAATGRTCAPTDRTWPAITNALGNGCVYGCYPHKGCNAHDGCYCP